MGYLEQEWNEIERVDQEVDRLIVEAVALCGFDPPCELHLEQAERGLMRTAQMLAEISKQHRHDLGENDVDTLDDAARVLFRLVNIATRKGWTA